MFSYKISKRHLAKTISWRLLGSIDTFVISLFFTNDLRISLKIILLEVITKMILYYTHERVWFKSKFNKTNYRHIYKTFTWRFIGTLDTIILSSIFTLNPFTGLKIGITENLTKMFLYFIHEKLWYRINYGLKNRKSKL